ncbi:LamG domain-containing protein [Paenibacillus sp. M2]|uniref:LamG domain-containing protein n=1 Tax=Paenibacillus sp. M2 TaxID=3341793 RepID=UPI003989D780
MANHKNNRLVVDSTGVNRTAGAQNTVEFWMFWRGDDGQMPFGFDNYDIYLVSGSLGINTNNSDVIGIASSGLANKWVHVTAVFYNGVPNASNLEIYINGVKQTLAQRLGSSRSMTVSNSAAFGGWSLSTSYQFNGYIRNARIWNRKLSASEVTTVMNTAGAVPTGNGLVGQWYTTSIENVAPQYDYAFASGYSRFDPVGLLTPNTTYPFDDNGDPYAGFTYQWDVPIRFTKLRFKSHPSYPIKGVSIYVDNVRVVTNLTITNTWYEASGNWYGSTVTLVRTGTGDQTIQQVEFYGDVLNKDYSLNVTKVGEIPAWYVYNMQMVQIDNTLDVIGDTGHGGNDIWHMVRTATVGGSVSYVRNYQLTGMQYTTTHPDCYDYNPWNDHLYIIHDEDPYTMYKYRINKPSMNWNLTYTAKYTFSSSLSNGGVLVTWAGTKFAFNKQTNEGYAYLLANGLGQGTTAKLYKIKLDTPNAIPEFVVDIPWYAPNNLVSFAVTDEYVFLPLSGGVRLGAYSKRYGNLANSYPMVGNKLNSYFSASSFNYGGATYITANGYQFGLIQLSVRNKRPLINDLKATPATLTREDFRVTAMIGHTNDLPASYKIFVNGVEKATVSSLPVPITVNHLLSNRDLVLGSNTITLEAIDTHSAKVTAVATVLKTNTDPFLNITASTLTCHKEHISLEVVVSDAEKDKAKFQILLNGVAKYPDSGGFTESLNTPYTYVYSLRNSDLLIGDNTVIVNAVDEYGATVSKNLIVSKLNKLPLVEAEVKGQTLFAHITDDDGDAVRYKVLINGSQVYPPSAGVWTQYIPTPIDVQFMIPKEVIVFGNTHKVEIVMEDDMGETKTWQETTLIDYAGLMFISEDGQYYSTNIGEVLKYLEVGTIVAGNLSGMFKVTLKNTIGYEVKNIILTTAQKDLNPTEEVVELSLTDKPFTATNRIEVDSLAHAESVPFYVRINASPKAIGGGEFDVRVVGDPA